MIRRAVPLLLVPAVVAMVLPAPASPGGDLQVTLNRLAAEAAEFTAFAPCRDLGGRCDTNLNVAVTVFRLDTGEHAEVNGDIWHVSLSAVKALWVAAAVDVAGARPVRREAGPIFRRSDDAAAARVVNLAGGVAAVNGIVENWGLTDTEMHGWPGAQRGRWGTNNFTTTDDLATFWKMLAEGDLLDPGDTTRVLRWAALPRDSEGHELLTPRLPADVAENAPHKSGWLYGDLETPSRRRIHGGLIITPDGIRYAVAIAVQAATDYGYSSGSVAFARYASCEIYAAVSGTSPRCTRSRDPAVIVDHAAKPIGSLNRALAERDRLRAAGWALDRDVAPHPVDVRIRVDGEKVATVTADLPRPAIGRRYGLGEDHGMWADVTVALTPGEHRVCAIAVNDGKGRNTEIGCETVVVDPDWPPVGALKRASLDGDRLRVSGWAKDRDTDAAIDVYIKVDGDWVGTVTADRGRGGHGFGAELELDLGDGDHRVCAVAVNADDGPNRPIGCLAVSAG